MLWAFVRSRGGPAAVVVSGLGKVCSLDWEGMSEFRPARPATVPSVTGKGPARDHGCGPSGPIDSPIRQTQLPAGAPPCPPPAVSGMSGGVSTRKPAPREDDGDGGLAGSALLQLARPRNPARRGRVAIYRSRTRWARRARKDLARSDPLLRVGQSGRRQHARPDAQPRSSLT